MARLLAVLLLVLLAGAGGCSLSDDSDDSGPPQLGGQGRSGGQEDGENQSEEVIGIPPATTKSTTRLGGTDPVADAAAVASAVFPGATAATRPNAVILVDRDDWQGGVAASVFMSDPLVSPTLLSDDDELSDISADTLERLSPTGADLLEDAQVISVGQRVPRPEGRRTEVIAGDDPYALAAAIDQTSSSVRGEPSGNVIVTTGERAAYAMPAAAWAARSGDSILYTKRDELPEPTRKALREHQMPDIYVLGPETVVSQRVERELRKLGSVSRIAGDDPVENAVEFARFREEDFGWGIAAPGQNFTVANVDRPLDAAAAAPLATKGTFAPLLLTDRADRVPPALESYLLDVQPGYEDNPNESVFNRVTVLGDEDALSLAAQARLDEITELVPVDLEGTAAPDDGTDQPDPDRPPDPGGRGGTGPGAPESQPPDRPRPNQPSPDQIPGGPSPPRDDTGGGPDAPRDRDNAPGP